MSARRQATADRESRVRVRPDAEETAGAEPAGTAPAGTESAGGEATVTAPAGSGTAGSPLAGSGSAGSGPAGSQPAGPEPAGSASVARSDGLTARPAAIQPSGSESRAADAGRGADTAKPARKRPARLATRVPASQRRGAQPGSGRRQPAEFPATDPTAADPSSADPPVTDPPVTDLPVRTPSPPTEQQLTDGLSARLMALARMIQIGSARSGRNGFGKKLLADAEEVLARAGERMRLSSSHTVVVLAGGTGSGKSSLFNRLAGADLSTVGVTRPVTRDAHACVWGDAASGPILDWLNVPPRYRYLRASALDSGEDDLAGLVLLDLPDHDSVMTHAGELVDQLVSMADVMVWVLDPQKYADAAVHRRFLVPMAGHSDVLAVVLNQSDLLEAAQVDDCVADLRRLLDSEDLHEVPILVTSAVSGAGLAELRQLLGDGVAARRAAATRISADLDRVIARFDPYSGDVGTPAGGVPAASKTRLADRLAAAAGISAISDALRSARELRAVDFVGWPVAWFIQRLSGRDPIRKVRLGMLWNDLRSVTAGPAGAQQAEIDNALTDLGGELAGPLPKPWTQTVRTAVRSRADEIPAAVGSAIGEALPAEDSVVWWWRLAGLWQGLLLGTASVAIVWLALVIAFGVFHAASGVPRLLSDTGALPWIGAGAVVALGLGAATASVCLRLVASTAERENTQVTADMRERIAGVADAMVIVPAELELSEFNRYREEARIASRDAGTDPAS